MTAHPPKDVDAPVVIVGNGPVGQTAALLLARWGLASVVLDRRVERDLVGSKAICQQREVLDIWSAVGAGEQIAAEGVTWRTARTFVGAQELFATTFADQGRSPFPPFVNISQARTEAIIDQQMVSNPLVGVHWGHEVVSLKQDDTGVTLFCETEAGAVTVRAAYVLMCAGARSDELRADLGLGFEGRTFDDQFLICDIRASLPGWEQERRFYFDPDWNPGRQVLIHPCPDSTFRIDWQVPPGYDLDQEERSGDLDKRIRQIVGTTPYEIVWKSVYRFHSRIVDRMVVGRVLVAGDCAHLMAPFGARGLNSGVQDVENAAWKLAFVLKGWAPPALLDSYQDERYAAALENLDITAATMDFLVPQTPQQATRRASILDRAMTTDPAARAAVDSGRLSEPFWYVDSSLTTSDPARPFAGRPTRGEVPDPGPGILIPDLPVRHATGCATRLRELVRDGLLVLTGSEIACAEVEAVMARETAAPFSVLAACDLDAGQEERPVSDVVGIQPSEMWLIRPDGYVAAVARVPAELTRAVRRTLALDNQKTSTGQDAP